MRQDVGVLEPSSIRSRVDSTLVILFIDELLRWSLQQATLTGARAATNLQSQMRMIGLQ